MSLKRFHYLIFDLESALDGARDIHSVHEVQHQGGRVQLLTRAVGAALRGAALRSPQTRYVQRLVSHGGFIAAFSLYSEHVLSVLLNRPTILLLIIIIVIVVVYLFIYLF